MALHKVLGIETEFGIMATPAEEQNPTGASALLINSYLDSLANAGLASNRHRVAWDFSDEAPGVDARGVLTQFALPPEIETHLVNAVLTNGARFYVDHAHPEYSSPEVANALEAVQWDRAGELIIQRSMAAVERFFGDNIRIKTYKNNSDGKGNSYGCHENFTVDRRTPFADIVRCLTPHLITRQVLCGAGKVGFESPDRFGVSEGFQVSQRADFFEAEVGLETTLKRPIINTRDEPHSDSHRYRRLHVIIGDANLSEWATFVKLGTTALVLCLIEDGEISEDFRPLDPVRTLRDVSADIDLEHSFTTRSGARLSALDIQELLCERAQKWAARSSFDAVGGDEVGTLIVAEWQQAIDDLRADPLLCADRIEWVAKRQLCERFAERHNLLAGDPRLSALGLQYHDMAPGKGIAEKLNFRRLVDSSLIEHAVDFAPSSTRAWFRGECLRRFPDQIVSANWDSLVVDAGGPKLRRIPMMEPLRGTELQTSNAFANSSSMNDVLTWLEST